MKIPDWLKTILAQFDAAEQPFMEISVMDAINGAANKQGAIPGEDRSVVQSKWSAFGFATQSDTESGWGTYLPQ
jgi:hypothetical protein